MKNIALIIEYDGTDFHGWQRQDGLMTVQALLENAISEIAETQVTLYGSSRTDTGVHAAGQVANFWVETNFLAERWRPALNKKLPPSIRVVRALEMPMDFHAQKGVKSKIYQYRVLNRSFASALDRRVYFYPKSLRWDRIQASLPYFVGKKDFKAFQGAKSAVKTTSREILRFELKEELGNVFRFEVEGTGFLKQMVRTLVGTAIEVGEGKRNPLEINEIFDSLDRNFAGRTLPPQGLTLVEVRYLNVVI